MTTQHHDSTVRRIVVEYGHWYVYMYLADDAGKVLDEERFTQPFRLDRKEIHEEATDGYQNIYQWLLDTCVFSASNDPKPPDSKED